MENFLTPEQKRELQLSELEILDELKRICDENGLKYYLTAGTLLGAVRHGGFIPWDDDIDVVMTREDFDKLARIARSALSDGFFYQDERSDKGYPFQFSKIRKNGTEVYEPILSGVKMHKGHYLDIFPLDRCPASPARAGRFFKAVELLNCAIIARLSRDFKCQYEKKLARAAFAVLKSLPLPLLKLLRRAVTKFYRHTSDGKCLATVSGSHGYPRESYERGWFDGTAELTFEGKQYSVPTQWDKLLTRMYGDYMTPPPQDEQIGHFRNNGNNDEIIKNIDINDQKGENQK